METFDRIYNTYLADPLVGSGKNRTTTCPFCERENKFSVDITTGQGRCLAASCDVKTNHITFLTKFHAAWLEATTDAEYRSLAKARGISVSTLKMAKFAYDSYTDRWLVPYKHGISTNLTNLGYFQTKGKNAYRIYKSPNIKDEVPLSFYNPYQSLAKPKTDTVCIVEGEWDTLALMDLFKDSDDRPAVVGVPGAMIFPEKYKSWFKKFKHIHLYYDNDEAGALGKEKAVSITSHWPQTLKGLDWTAVPEVPENYDIRDMLINRNGQALNQLTEALTDVETSAEDKELSAGYVASVEDIEPVDSFDQYLDMYSRYMHLSQCNREAMAITMAISTCQYMPGEPLWAFAVSPAGAGKTTLIESYGGQNEYFDCASRITSKSLVSGFNAGKAETSLLPRMNGKTFFIKDFTVVLGMPKEQRKEVFNLLRDIYDGTLNITFGNGKVCDFHNLRFNLIAGVTDAIKEHNDASMGERFLRYDYTGTDIDDEAIINAALGSFGQTNDRKRALTEATLGYVKTLALPQNRWDLNNIPSLGQPTIDRLSSYARYTAFIRTKAEHDRKDGLKYRPRKEVAARLALQYAKMGFALEKVFNPQKKANKQNQLNFSEKTLAHIGKLTHDTSEGFNQEVIKLLHTKQLENRRLGRKDLSVILKLGDSRIHKTMTDLKATGLVNVTLRNNDKSRNKDTKGRPSEYYTVHPGFQDVVKEVFTHES